MPLSALAKLIRVVDGNKQPIGRAAAEAIHTALVEKQILDAEGRIQPAFNSWERLLFKNEELINYLNALQVNKSVYEYVVYDSAVEREFARHLDEREDIKLFLKLPNWFEVVTPVGKYNPDWAILKQDGQALYLVRETKGTRDFLTLRTSEADKVRCGPQHFATLGVPFAIAVTADEV